MPSRFILQRAAHVFYAGGLIAYPTEAVFGLGCDPLNANAVETLLSLKNRSIEKGLILISDKIEKLLPFIDVNKQQIKTLEKDRPRPTTWLVRASKLTPSWIKGRHQKVAIRITQHSIAQKLCQHLNSPIVSTSANPSHRAAAKNSLQVQQYFNQNIDLIISGTLGSFDKPSQIIDLSSLKTIRA